MIKKVINFPMYQEELVTNLLIPENPIGLIVFAHGSGSSASSSRNQVVAQMMNNNGFGALLFDLLTKGEKEFDMKAQNIIGKVPGITLNKFNIELLSKRLKLVTQWIQTNNDTKNLDFGYFGTSTGAAAALYAAASLHNIKALVSRGGRPDLVDKETLEEISCPTLFIIGEKDEKIIGIHRKKTNQLKNVRCNRTEIIKGASHLFEEEGKLKQVAELAIDWYKTYFRS